MGDFHHVLELVALFCVWLDVEEFFDMGHTLVQLIFECVFLRVVDNADTRVSQVSIQDFLVLVESAFDLVSLH